MSNCPYCGEEQRAVKNHVRLASGNGHGPSGQYPDDFDEGATSEPDAETDDGDTTETPDQSDGETETDLTPQSQPSEGGSDGGKDTVEMSPDEMQEMIEAASETAYNSGYNDAKQEQEPVEVESTVEDTSTDTDTETTADTGTDTSTVSSGSAPNRSNSSSGSVLSWIFLGVLSAAFALVLGLRGNGDDEQNMASDKYELKGNAGNMTASGTVDDSGGLFSGLLGGSDEDELETF